MKQTSPKQTLSNPRKDLADEIRKLVLARMQATPKNLKISIGSSEYTTEELIQSVKRGDEIGQQVIDMQMEFLREMAQGKIYSDDEE